MALKHTYEKAFSVGNGMRRNVPKLVVAITDGRSQDEVKKSAAKLQQAGNGCFPNGEKWLQNLATALIPAVARLQRLRHRRRRRGLQRAAGNRH